MNLKTKIKNWLNAEDRDELTLSNIRRIIRAYYRKYFPLVPKHITEEAAWRLTQVRPVCKNQGSCTICGCPLAELVFDDDPCKGRCYPAMRTKKQWNIFKKFENIK